MTTTLPRVRFGHSPFADPFLADHLAEYVGNWKAESIDQVLDEGQMSYGCYRDLQHAPQADELIGENLLLDLPYCSGSDYSGSTVEASNYKEIKENWSAPWLIDVWGDFGTFALAVHVGTFLRYWLAEKRGEQMPEGVPSPDEFLRVVKQLGDYPCVDDEALSMLEMERADEAWDNWAEYDFKRALRPLLSEEQEDQLDNKSSADLREFFETMRERANEYWESDGQDMHVRMDRVVAEIDEADIAEFLAK